MKIETDMIENVDEINARIRLPRSNPLLPFLFCSLLFGALDLQHPSVHVQESFS